MNSTLTHPDALHVDKLLTCFQRSGFTITAVDDGQDVTTINPYLNPDTARAIAVDAITAVDAAWLRISKAGETATLFLVLGNEPDCLVCDCTSGHKFDTELDTCVDDYSNSLK
jgi:hypothetical protein